MRKDVQISLDGNDTTSLRSRSDVDHQDFILCQFLNLSPPNSPHISTALSIAKKGEEGTDLGLFLIIRFDSQQPPQQEVTNFNLCINTR